MQQPMQGSNRRRCKKRRDPTLRQLLLYHLIPELAQIVRDYLPWCWLGRCLNLPPPFTPFFSHDEFFPVNDQFTIYCHDNKFFLHDTYRQITKQIRLPGDSGWFSHLSTQGWLIRARSCKHFYVFSRLDPVSSVPFFLRLRARSILVGTEVILLLKRLRQKSQTRIWRVVARTQGMHPVQRQVLAHVSFDGHLIELRDGYSFAGSAWAGPVLTWHAHSQPFKSLMGVTGIVKVLDLLQKYRQTGCAITLPSLEGPVQAPLCWKRLHFFGT